MAIELDHLILAVNDVARSLAFYVDILGLAHEGERPPMTIVRVTPRFTLQLAPWGTKGGEHLAFAMSREEFERVFGRVRAAGIPYGDRFDGVGNMREPGDEPAAQGMGKAIYFFDPDQHLIEIRHYELS